MDSYNDSDRGVQRWVKCFFTSALRVIDATSAIEGVVLHTVDATSSLSNLLKTPPILF
ncbi:MAG: hypothetical protein HC881_11275 [Leptolyngbyaceae cyanobacterium SL_7_1]|nr:hypothetical protein [Leptolyngbyaceae cyanobacterium SL_7_1]